MEAIQREMRMGNHPRSCKALESESSAGISIEMKQSVLVEYECTYCILFIIRNLAYD